eukprot:CAMPEP_0176056684 /NCGR_PEP_ID=MMETSP0120_2-20121206/28229_1 /TAXON_ID=160619 /ORGANISM="Kryptoperidinium foliaceum, Strain CCMP 1326" /LENGTH=62 /DNA_ID=CAMNT_0017390191 /DNA_START=271 /DNA_END=456 /DNA_ORIENTATION=-
MFRTWKRLMALSLGTHREQLQQRTMAVWPRPCLERPLLRRFDGIAACGFWGSAARCELGGLS